MPRLECGTAYEVSSPHSALIRQSAWKRSSRKFAVARSSGRSGRALRTRTGEGRAVSPIRTRRDLPFVSSSHAGVAGGAPGHASPSRGLRPKKSTGKPYTPRGPCYAARSGAPWRLPVRARSATTIKSASTTSDAMPSGSIHTSGGRPKTLRHLGAEQGVADE